MRWIPALFLCATLSPVSAIAAGVASDVQIEQIGQASFASTVLTGPSYTNEPSTTDVSEAPETALLRQLGVGDSSSIRQSGGNDWAEVTQLGAQDRSTIVQTGANDYASVWQSSANAQSTITQTGANNIARVRQ
jgi:hypothetical protein